jgi:5-methylcytosine-specific restriction endonuclease McrA
MGSIPWQPTANDDTKTFVMELRTLILSPWMQPHGILGQKVDVLEAYEATVASAGNRYEGRAPIVVEVPAVVRLRKAVRMHKDGVKFSRANVYTRDRCTCFAGGTRILMADGRQAPIEIVRPGDRVIDAFGVPQEVIANGERIVDDAVAIKHRGSFERTVTTPEHPFLTPAGFRPISEKPEFLTFPRHIQYEARPEETFDVGAAMPPDRWMRLKGGRVYWSRRGHEHGLATTLRSSRELAYFLGLYVAEGSANNGLVALSFCDDEEHTLAVDAARLLQTQFGLPSTTDVRHDRHTCVVRCGSRALGIILQATCGHGARHKKVPWGLIGPYHSEFLRGLFLGDGTIDRKRRKVALGMTAYDVVFGAQSMLWGFGIYPTIQTWHNPERQKVWLLMLQGANYSTFMREILGEEVEPGETIFGNEQSVYRRLQEIEPVDGETIVYNLETSGSHSYIANGLAVHNCCYCGERKHPRELNYDHVVPRERGGKTVWENIVTACFACNSKKRNRTPAEAGMKMHYQPHRPRVLSNTRPLLMDLAKVPQLWIPYLTETTAVG